MALLKNFVLIRISIIHRGLYPINHSLEHIREEPAGVYVFFILFSMALPILRGSVFLAEVRDHSLGFTHNKNIVNHSNTIESSTFQKPLGHI